jgi:hypothetical protein
LTVPAKLGTDSTPPRAELAFDEDPAELALNDPVPPSSNAKPG